MSGDVYPLVPCLSARNAVKRVPKLESGRHAFGGSAMHRQPKMLLTTALLVVAASITMAQEPYHSSDPDVMARLSYDSSGVVQQGNVRHICVAVSRDGEYRIVR